MTGADMTEGLTVITEMFKRQEQKAENKEHGGPTCMDFIVHWERWVI